MRSLQIFLIFSVLVVAGFAVAVLLGLIDLGQATDAAGRAIAVIAVLGLTGTILTWIIRSKRPPTP